MLGRITLEPVKARQGRVDHRTHVFVRLGHGSIVGLAVSDDAPYGEATRRGELEIALIVPGNGHHGPGTVGGDDEIAEPHRDALPRQRVNHVQA